MWRRGYAECMETALRLLLNFSISVFLLVGTYWIYLSLEKLAYEAYEPRYVEVPVFIEKPPVKAATSSGARP